jgi:hypothetical protein
MARWRARVVLGDVVCYVAFTFVPVELELLLGFAISMRRVHVWVYTVSGAGTYAGRVLCSWAWLGRLFRSGNPT